MKSWALATSIVVHSAIAAFALVRCSPEVSAAPPPVKESQPGQQVLDVRLIPSSDDGDDELNCEASYRGIGIRTSDGAHIREVAPGGPAHKAGLQVDDVIVNADLLWPDRYMVGHKLTLLISRDGREFPVVVVIGRICTE